MGKEEEESRNFPWLVWKISREVQTFVFLGFFQAFILNSYSPVFIILQQIRLSLDPAATVTGFQFDLRSNVIPVVLIMIKL